ncbi:major facilitator superfamily domain-containing protein 4A [Boleophthalmus pectinirostris]|uniref:major facilitator superfamily domain-containing protein 4A n=1 Tax=Boleophthalmus pectinirostris TaxID=150288 RepID=UPI00242DA684|nr:major facilitator superfamily domain-containing protein 4A [Boleophthalmus pectinirostris]
MTLWDDRVWALFRSQWKQTVIYWSVFFSFGLCIAFLGPTILDLRCQTHSTLQQITWVFFSQQLFLLLGSSVGGIFKRTLLFSLVALFTCTFIISLVFLLIPLCYSVIMLSIVLAIAGLAMGVIDNVANLQLVKLYQKDSAIFLQALHFFIGLGALVSPLVADPFLSDDACILAANATVFNSSFNLEHIRNTLAGPGAALTNMSEYPLHIHGMALTQVSYAFWIMALISLPVPIAVLYLMYHERLLPCSRTSPPLLEQNPSGDTEQVSLAHKNVFRCCNLDKVRDRPATFFVLQIVGGAILFITDGIIGSYAGFVYTYAVSPPLLMAHKTAGYLDSIFWAAITLSRLAFIYLSYRYPAPKLLIFSLIGVVLIHGLLLLFYTSQMFLFIGTTILGLCISSVFPSMLAFTEDALEYKGCATTVLVTSASTGEMLMQLLIGSVIQDYGSYAFMLCCMIASFLGFCLFLLFLYVHHLHKNSYSHSTDCTKDMDMKKIPPSLAGS